jgi:hydrogenase assembly chaperone HypC/HupF
LKQKGFVFFVFTGKILLGYKKLDKILVMCLTIPKKVIEIKKNEVVVEAPNGSRQNVKTIVELKIGDYVLTQQNVVVEKITEKEAKEILNIMKGG